MAENTSSPVFAERYRFEPVGDDWDTGRSGFTHLVYDLKLERFGVIKRAEAISKQAIEGLTNEVMALKSLHGLGVPEVYETGEAIYGSKKYVYMVIEHIDGVRVEKELSALSADDRAEILTQFFALLTEAHRRGIVNGDIDLKHLFWRRAEKRLVVIDWGNAKLGVNPKKKSEFAYDLARSAEIIYSLVTRQGHPPATGSITLPNDSALIPGLAPLPPEYRNLCKWAPRTPQVGARAPQTASELVAVSDKWLSAIKNARAYRASRFTRGTKVLAGFLFIAISIFLLMLPNSPLWSLIAPQTPTIATAELQTSSPTAIDTIEPTGTLFSTSSPTATLAPTLTTTFTITPTITPPPPRTYSQSTSLLIFDRDNSPTGHCWTSETNLHRWPRPSEGFTRREDGYWRFAMEEDRTKEDFIKTDFSQCLPTQQVKAIGMNVWVPRLESEREFGFFLEDKTGQRREYTLWIDREKIMHLSIREPDRSNYELLVVNQRNLKFEDAYPRYFYSFPIQLLFEINNQGLDILYLREGPIQLPARIEDMDPSQMIRIDLTIRPTMGSIQKIGLVGYGGEMQTVIWPLAFLGE